MDADQRTQSEGYRISWCRSVKRKVENIGEIGQKCSDSTIYIDLAARVDAENEIKVLREAVASQQKKIAELCKELEQERAASSSSATEAMSMILRLQREKAAVLMEARQFKRFAEEKMAHDQQELIHLEEVIYKREQSLQALSCEVQAFRHRLLSYGLDPDFIEEQDQNLNWADEFPYKTPHRRAHLMDLERRILDLEQAPNETNEGGKQEEEFPTGDEDREYTIDAVHVGTPVVKECENYLTGSEDISRREETEIQRLYTRLQALEADRESMKQAILSMQTEKTQVLLREIAQQMYRECPSKKVVTKKQPSKGRFSFLSAIKWVVSFVFGWKPKKQTRYMFDEGRLGLLLLLENSLTWRQHFQRILHRLRGKSTIGFSPPKIK